jgi:hypothetical protein
MQHLRDILRRVGPGVHAAVWTAVLAVVGWTGCSLPADECNAGDSRCNGAEVESCRVHHGGLYGDGYHEASPNSWEPDVDCGSADLCKTATYVDSSGNQSTDAFCALDPRPDPVCGSPTTTGSTTSACEGTRSVDCYAGYAVARRLCATCAGSTCTGAIGDDCSGAGGCASGFVCLADVMRCAMPCSCPEGATCDTCAPAETDAPGAPAFLWVCSGGYCEQQSN